MFFYSLTNNKIWLTLAASITCLQYDIPWVYPLKTNHSMVGQYVFRLRPFLQSTTCTSISHYLV